MRREPPPPRSESSRLSMSAMNCDPIGKTPLLPGGPNVRPKTKRTICGAWVFRSEGVAAAERDALSCLDRTLITRRHAPYA